MTYFEDAEEDDDPVITGKAVSWLPESSRKASNEDNKIKYQ